jgi:hypothetical protein
VKAGKIEPGGQVTICKTGIGVVAPSPMVSYRRLWVVLSRCLTAHHIGA